MTKKSKEQIQEYLADNHSETINAADIGRLFGVSRQRAWSILEALGETRHRRPPKVINLCAKCSIRITKGATFCREHAPKRQSPFLGILRDRLPGHTYQCRLCLEFKVLEKFAKSKQYSSGYETRCLDCRADWQREYHRTDRGKQSHSNSTKSLSAKHPERQRAYYRVHKAIQNGTLQKQPCEYCQSVDSKAIQQDYNYPLDIVWLCPLCSHRLNLIITAYQPHPIEEKFRIFIQNETGHSKWISKWLHIIKEHYDTSTIDENVLKNSSMPQQYIKGLGKTYHALTKKFLKIECELDY